MKKLFTAFLIVLMLTLTSVPVFAATPTFVCPNNNIACVKNGECVTKGDCINRKVCTKKGNCQKTNDCLNACKPKRDGTGKGQGHKGGRCISVNGARNSGRRN